MLQWNFQLCWRALSACLHHECLFMEPVVTEPFGFQLWCQRIKRPHWRLHLCLARYLNLYTVLIEERALACALTRPTDNWCCSSVLLKCHVCNAWWHRAVLHNRDQLHSGKHKRGVVRSTGNSIFVLEQAQWASQRTSHILFLRRILYTYKSDFLYLHVFSIFTATLPNEIRRSRIPRRV